MWTWSVAVPDNSYSELSILLAHIMNHKMDLKHIGVSI
jgi:hypothetical protein